MGIIWIIGYMFSDGFLPDAKFSAMTLLINYKADVKTEKRLEEAGKIIASVITCMQKKEREIIT